jgi:hypothetical protein
MRRFGSNAAGAILLAGCLLRCGSDGEPSKVAEGGPQDPPDADASGGVTGAGGAAEGGIPGMAAGGRSGSDGGDAIVSDGGPRGGDGDAGGSEAGSPNGDAGTPDAAVRDGAAADSQPGDASDGGGSAFISRLKCPSGLPRSLVRFDTTLDVAPKVATAGHPGMYYATGAFRATLSRDGSTVSGSFTAEIVDHTYKGSPTKSSLGLEHWFRWSGNTFTDLGVPEGFIAGFATAVDCTGKTIAGDMWKKLPSVSFEEGWEVGANRAFRFREGEGLKELAPTNASELTDTSIFDVTDISADGMTILGSFTDFDTVNPGAGNKIWIGDEPPVNRFPAASNDRAYGMSADAGVFYGRSGDFGAWWTGNELAQLIVDPGAERTGTGAISAEGRYIAGPSYFSGGGSTIYLYSPPVGIITYIGSGDVWRMSAEGRVVVGQAAESTVFGDRDFIWDRAHGKRSLREILRLHGISLPAGWIVDVTYDVSDDGRVLAGVMSKPNTFPYESAVFRAVLAASDIE